MTIRHLKLFLEVYKTMNITKAAENVNMTQPTVTRAIQELEEHYGMKFFDRINRRLSATEAGNKFYSYAGKTIEAFEHMESSMSEWHQKEVIRIGATISIGSVLIPQIVNTFKKRHPDVLIKISVDNCEHLQQLLYDNQLDFALLEGFVPGEHIYYEAFTEDELVLLLQPNDERCKKKVISFEELADDAFLLREKGSVGRNYVDVLFSSHGLPLDPVMESVSVHTIVNAVHSGLGISIVPKNLVKHSITSGFVGSCEIEDVNMVRKNYIVWHEGKYITDTMHELMELCKKVGGLR
ncbi:MAG: LysR family transcriptional regulator [Lachnospiraceae bacterium]|nr:LysR family transcriptional regulator [Lachnospiraceae bacterium]